MSGGDIPGRAHLLKNTVRGRRKPSDATYTFADGRKVRARTDDSCEYIAKVYGELFGTTAPQIVEEARDWEGDNGED